MGYQTAIIRYLNKRPHIIKNRSVLTLGKLYPSPQLFGSISKIIPEIESVSRDGFSEAFLKDHLKASKVSVGDVDAYQGADLIVNLNKPVESDLIDKFDTLIDFGTLEHLSNLTCAIENYFKLLKPGGFYCFLLPANNWLDHGFFQFSPTFFTDFCAQNDGIVGRDLFYVCSNRLLHFSESDHYIRRVLAKTSQPVFIGGLIEKITPNVCLDLLQSKYISSYKSNENAKHSQVAKNEACFPQEEQRKRVFRSLISRMAILPTSTQLVLLEFFKSG